MNPVGAEGEAAGVTEDEILEGDDPAELSAATRNVYEVPFVKPVTTQESGPVVHVQVNPPGVDVTTYEVIVDPPLESGATQVTVAV